MMMKGRLKAVLVIALVFSLLAVVPALAAERGDRAHGDWDIELYFVPCPDGRLLTWSGTLDFDGRTYGQAGFPTVPTVFRGPNAYFAEDWTVFVWPDNPTPDEIVAASCDADLVILSGHDVGYCAGTWCGAKGIVEDSGPMADPYGFLGPSFVGHQQLWNGHITGPTSFDGTWWLHPLRR